MMDYDAYDAGSDEWVLIENAQTTYDHTPISSFITYGDKAWAEIVFRPKRGGRTYLEDPWMTYCRETGYDKEIYVPYEYVYNLKDNTLTLEDVLYHITLINNHDIYVYALGDTTQDGVTLYKKSKSECILNREKTKKADLKKIIFYDSLKDAKLAMIAMIRRHYGDEMVIQRKGKPDEVYDLAKLEDDIRNNQDTYNL